MGKLTVDRPPIGTLLKNVRIEVQYCCAPKAIRVTQHGEGEATTFSFTEAATLPSKWGDWKAIRDEFASVEDTRGALAFLKRCGSFSPYARSLSFGTFRAWQRYFNAQRLGEHLADGTPEHFGDIEVHKTLVGRPEVKIIRVPSEKRLEIKAWIECSSALEVIAAGNFIDRMAGVAPPRKCLQCGKAFQPPTKRRTYCGKTCTDEAFREGKRVAPNGKQVVKRVAK